MSNFVINQTASEIQQILNKADQPDTTPTLNSQNLVESGGVKTYIDTQLSAGAAITTSSFAASALNDTNTGISSLDTAVPTSGLVSSLYSYDTNIDTLTNSSMSTSWTNVSAGENPTTVSVTNTNSNNITGSGTSITVAKGLYAVNLSSELQIGRYATGYMQVSFGTYASATDDTIYGSDNNTLETGVLRIGRSNSGNGSTLPFAEVNTSGLVNLSVGRTVNITFWVTSAASQARTVEIQNTKVEFFKLL